MFSLMSLVCFLACEVWAESRLSVAGKCLSQNPGEKASFLGEYIRDVDHCSTAIRAAQPVSGRARGGGGGGSEGQVVWLVIPTVLQVRGATIHTFFTHVEVQILSI